MIERRHGRVVTVASMAGLLGVAGLCDYCASKFGAVGFDEALRMELHRLGVPGVTTTCVCPYYIATGMFSGVAGRWPFSLLFPILEPEYVADRVVYATARRQPQLCLPRLGDLPSSPSLGHAWACAVKVAFGCAQDTRWGCSGCCRSACWTRLWGSWASTRRWTTSCRRARRRRPKAGGWNTSARFFRLARYE